MKPFKRFPYNRFPKTGIPNSKNKDQEFITPEYKETVRSNSYIGKKGYTIQKTALHTNDYEFLKKDLYMIPFTMGPSFGNSEDSNFPVYRENAAKIYVPRFYGIKRYGLPDNSELSEGEDIDISFVKELRDYQTNVVNIYLKYVNTPISMTSRDECGNGCILELPCGYGKTVLSLKIIAELKKKTLILVHKEFLMNQWIERINEFLPSARVGKIQGPVYEVEGKDIVIGMIQTLHSRDFPSEAFSPFGLTIIDEVHRIGSEEFSKTLLKTLTPYMLGISATVERKDRLTKVLYMFIGDKIYSVDRNDDDPVNIRSIEFKTNDREFNETEYDFRGAPKYSTMISKLCEYGPRSDFIVTVIHDLIKENEHKQIMVLAHNRALLTYLYDAIHHRISNDESTVGYYVGGMKEKDLKITESKKIVLATYAMAAEALDIKTLSTLVMASPKTDIEQSVGRILRTRGQNPIVVDIVDSHEYLKGQWLKRKAFYKKCNYKIFSIPSTKYDGFMIDWSKPYAWKLEYDPKVAKTTSSLEKGKCLIQIQDEDKDKDKDKDEDEDDYKLG
jgi:superfamily II DNA or RNA helicase